MSSRTLMLLTLLSACSGSGGTPDAGLDGAPPDTGMMDASFDASAPDSGALDASATDAGTLAEDVAAIVEPLVDSSGADASRAVGLVVVMSRPAGDEVLPFGTLRAGGTTPVDRDSVFQLGSSTKVFTGLLLATLIETPSSGVTAEDAVNARLAADVRAPSAGGVEITLAHLASHFSSLPNFPAPATGPMFSPFAGYSRANLASFLSGTTLASPPGSSYAYSNLGSGLLGLALADTTGASGYGALLETMLTTPLGMTDTDLATDAFLGRMSDRLATGYSAQAGTLVEAPPARMGVLAGGGEILSTGGDMLTFMRVLTGVDAHPVAGAVERATTPLGVEGGGVQIAYGLNVFDRPDGTRRFDKAGSTAGYTSYMLFRRDARAGVILMANRGQFMALQGAARSILNLLAP